MNNFSPKFNCEELTAKIVGFSDFSKRYKDVLTKLNVAKGLEMQKSFALENLRTLETLFQTDVYTRRYIAEEFGYDYVSEITNRGFTTARRSDGKWDGFKVVEEEGKLTINKFFDGLGYLRTFPELTKSLANNPDLEAEEYFIKGIGPGPGRYLYFVVDQNDFDPLQHNYYVPPTLSENMVKTTTVRGRTSYLSAADLSSLFSTDHAYADDFSHGLACVGDDQDGYYFIDKTGKDPFEFALFNSPSYFSEGLAGIGYTDIQKWPEYEIESYFITPAGNRVGENYFRVKNFHDGRAWVQFDPPMDSKWYCIGHDFKPAFSDGLGYDSVYDFSEGFALVENEHKSFFIDTEGKKGFLDLPNFYVAESFKDGLAHILTGTRSFYIDKRGKIIFEDKL
ncbi:MAG: hypothetical protein NTW50_01675 [Candidatus Berkelbacteria bacterium]|nr:hypothetical protein [Candidatus Berkelbacteria bacterium]